MKQVSNKTEIPQKDKPSIFKRLRNDCSTHEQYFFELLKLRGFLLDEREECFYISDNSHEDDKEYLIKFIDGFGYLEGNKVVFNGNIDFEQIERLFVENTQISYEVAIEHRTWRYFKHRQHGHKVPVKELEPFIARYVKAISACGVCAAGSCDGNHAGSRKMFLQMEGKTAKLWHCLICERVLNEKFSIVWDEGYESIPFVNLSKQEVYYELNKAAEYLYENRKAIRQIKDKALENLTKSRLKHLSFDEIASIFIKNANDLFDKCNL